MNFALYQAAVDQAVKALEAAINQEFPVGSKVRYKSGRGWVFGEVAFPAQKDRVLVKSKYGRVHHRHYNDVLHDM